METLGTCVDDEVRWLALDVWAVVFDLECRVLSSISGSGLERLRCSLCLLLLLRIWTQAMIARASMTKEKMTARAISQVGVRWPTAAGSDVLTSFGSVDDISG
jgi:hypothetical protein